MRSPSALTLSAAAAALCLAVGGCSSTPTAAPAPTVPAAVPAAADDRQAREHQYAHALAFWTAAGDYEGVDEVDLFKNFDEMVLASDVVVVGRVVSVQPGRTFQDPEVPIDRFTYTRVNVRAEQVHGVPVLDRGLLHVESLFGGPNVGDAPPDAPALMVLREKRGRGEKGIYRLISSQGLLLEEPGGGVWNPYVEDLTDAEKGRAQEILEFREPVLAGVRTRSPQELMDQAGRTLQAAGRG
jgi:hypothetical protein